MISRYLKIKKIVMNKLRDIDIYFPLQGEIWLGKFDKIKEISKDFRPVLIVSNNLKNEFTDEVIIVTLTSEFLNDIGEFEILINNTKENDLDRPSKILADSIFTLNKELRLEKRLGIVNKDTISNVIDLIKSSVLSMKY